MAANHPYAGISACHFINSKADIHSYEDCVRFLGDECTKKLASNMLVCSGPRHLCNPLWCHVRLYETNIITYWRDGSFIVDHGGHITATTVTRLNQFGPHLVHFYRHRNRLWVSGVECGHARQALRVERREDGSQFVARAEPVERPGIFVGAPPIPVADLTPVVVGTPMRVKFTAEGGFVATYSEGPDDGRDLDACVQQALGRLLGGNGDGSSLTGELHNGEDHHQR